MRTTLAVFAVGLAIAASPALAQTTSPTPANPSQVGVPGKPGNKSGPATNPSGTAQHSAPGAAAGADPSGIKGKPGNKSGPAVKQPGHAQGNK